MNKKLIAALAIVLSTTTTAVYAEKKPADCKVNLNTATAEEIVECLDGVGAGIAEGLVEYREGKRKEKPDFQFKKLSDLNKVPRFGKKRQEANKGKVCFSQACVEGKPEQPEAEEGKGDER